MKNTIDEPAFHLYFSSMMETTQFEIRNAHKTYCPPDWQWDNSGAETDIYNLWLVTDGTGTMRVRSRTYPLQAGDCFLLPMDEPCHGRHDPQNPLTVPWIVFRATDQNRPWRPPALHRRVWRLSFLAELIEQTIAAHLGDTRAGEPPEDWLRVALHALADEDARAYGPQSNTGQIEAIHNACERIRCEPGHPWNVAKLARSCHLSPGHFGRVFKAQTGLAPRAFITRTRIETARALLRMSDHTIGEIADLLGYGDIFHFSRQFREWTGISPSAFRQNALLPSKSARENTKTT